MNSTSLCGLCSLLGRRPGQVRMTRPSGVADAEVGTMLRPTRVRHDRQSLNVLARDVERFRLRSTSKDSRVGLIMIVSASVSSTADAEPRRCPDRNRPGGRQGVDTFTGDGRNGEGLIAHCVKRCLQFGPSSPGCPHIDLVDDDDLRFLRQSIVVLR